MLKFTGKCWLKGKKADDSRRLTRTSIANAFPKRLCKEVLVFRGAPPTRMERGEKAITNEPRTDWLGARFKGANGLLFRVPALFLSRVATRNQSSSSVFLQGPERLWGESFSCDVVSAFPRIQTVELSGNRSLSRPNDQPGCALFATVELP